VDSNRIWLAPAKINLFLRIRSQRTDGMHELQTAFQFIDICDEIQILPRKDNKINNLTPIPGVGEDQDLCVRAARALQRYVAENGRVSELEGDTYGADIRVKKYIPMGGGMGGASSDAATVLRVLNYLWNLQLDFSQLCALGLSLGADVPVFIQGQAAWAEGVGEQLTKLENMKEYWYLIVDPGINVNTAQMFADSQLTRHSDALTICPPKPGALGNVFESVVRAKYAKVDEIFDCLKPHCQPFLTGSGGCVLAAFSDKASAQAMRAVCPQGMNTHVAKSMNSSPLNAQLASLS